MKLVLAAATMGAAQAFVAPSAFSGASVTASRVSATSPVRMSLADYKEELAATAKAIAGPGESLLPPRRVQKGVGPCVQFSAAVCPLHRSALALEDYFCMFRVLRRGEVRSTYAHIPLKVFLWENSCLYGA